LTAQFVHRSASHDLSVNEKEKPATNTRGIRKLVNRKKESAPGRGLLAKKARYFNCLPRVESIEGFVQKEERVGRELAHHIVVNDDLERAVDEVAAILESRRQHRA